MDDVLAKEQLVFDQVIDQSTEKNDVRPSANRHPDVGQCARARESWIDMDNRGPLLFRFHYPAKTDRMRLGHGGAFDQNAIRVGQILLRSRSSATAEGGAQTGHRAAMSYPGLVGHTNHPQASGEKFFNEIIFFVIERGAAQMTDRCGVIDGGTLDLPDKCAFPRFPDALRHHVHRAIKRHFTPFLRARRAILHFRFASRMRKQLIRRSALWAKVPLTDRRFRIALD